MMIKLRLHLLHALWRVELPPLGIGELKEPSPQLKIKDNVEVVGHSQLLDLLKVYASLNKENFIPYQNRT